MPDITVHELKQRLDQGDQIKMIDVREREEYEVSNLGGKLVPLSEFAQRLDDLEPFRNEEVVIVCRSGSRSGRVTQFLRSQGFKNARNLTGGMMSWAANIDPSLPIA